MASPVVIGIDAGTTAVKAVAFSTDGAQIAAAHRTVPLAYGARGEVECDMTAIWDAVAICLGEVTAAIRTHPVLAVGVTGQGDGLWMLDAQHRPVHPTPCWMDGRSGDRVAAWEGDGRAEAVLDVMGTVTFAGLTPVLFAELSETEPEAMASVACVLSCKDWVRFNLTGVLGTDYSEASRVLLDVNTMQYSASLARGLGVAPLTHLLTPPSVADSVAGYVTASAATATGLPEGTPVSVGLIDVWACGLGLGAVDDGDGWLILGTTACVGVLLPDAAQRRSRLSMVMATGRGSQTVEFLAPTSSVPNLEWAARTLGLAGATHPELERLAESVAPGSGGVLYLPYGAPLGERAPFLDPQASAAWVGLGYATTTAQLLRAVYEGIAYALAECVETLELDGELVVSGGGSRSTLLCQVLADVLQRPIVQEEASEAGALGAAITALVAVGHCPDLRTGAEQLRSPSFTFQPDPAAGDAYKEGRALLAQVRDALKPAWGALRHHRAHTTHTTAANRSRP